MIKNNSGESIIGIIIGVFIISFIILGIANMLINSKSIIYTYEDKKMLSILKSNTENILKNIDTSSVLENETFYLYKNKSSRYFVIFTGSLNSSYMYIDQYGNNVSDPRYIDNIFTRNLLVEKKDSSLGIDQQSIKINIEKYVEK